MILTHGQERIIIICRDQNLGSRSAFFASAVKAIPNGYHNSSSDSTFISVWNWEGFLGIGLPEGGAGNNKSEICVNSIILGKT